ENAAVRRLDQERMDAQLEAAVLVGEMRKKPVDRPNRLARRLRQDETGAADRLQFDDPGDLDRAYVPGVGDGRRRPVARQCDRLTPPPSLLPAGCGTRRAKQLRVLSTWRGCAA